MPMDRKEAIERCYRLYCQDMTIMKEDAEAIQIAHQNLKQVEEVVGKCEEYIKIYKTCKRKNCVDCFVAIKRFENIIKLLTEEE